MRFETPGQYKMTDRQEGDVSAHAPVHLLTLARVPLGVLAGAVGGVLAAAGVDGVGGVPRSN